MYCNLKGFLCANLDWASDCLNLYFTNRDNFYSITCGLNYTVFQFTSSVVI